MINYSVYKISYEDTKPFILNIHYAKRMPSISYSFGLFYKNELVEKIFPVSLDDTEASYRGTLTQALKLSTDKDFLNYTNKLAEQAYTRFRKHPTELFLDYIFVKLYTRKPTKPEIAFFKAKLNFSKSFRSSGAFETVWTLMNSPEMRLY